MRPAILWSYLPSSSIVFISENQNIEIERYYWRQREALPLSASTAQKTMTQILQDFNKNLFLRSLKFSYVLNIIDAYKNLTVKINERRVDKNAFENLQCNDISLLHTKKICAGPILCEISRHSLSWFGINTPILKIKQKHTT